MGGIEDYQEYPNVSPMIGAIVSSGLATLSELGKDLSTEDAHDLVEIIVIDNYNRRPRK